MKPSAEDSTASISCYTLRRNIAGLWKTKFIWKHGLQYKNPCKEKEKILAVQFSSVTQSCPTLCDPMNCSIPGLPVHHQLPEFTQTHVHWVGDTIQPSHPLLSPSPPTFNLSQHQGLFQSVSSSQMYAFHKLMISGKPELVKAINITFPTALAHFQSSCQNLVILSISQTFSSLLYFLLYSKINNVDVWQNHYNIVK